MIDLVQRIYDAALDPSAWEPVLEGAASLLGGHAGMVGANDFASGASRSLARHHFPDELVQPWETGEMRDPWTARGLETLLSGRASCATGTQLLTPEEQQRPSPYRVMLQEAGMEDLLTMGLGFSRTSVAWLTLYCDRDEAPYGNDELEAFDFVGGHARRAFAISQLLRRAEDLACVALEHLPCAAFVCAGPSGTRAANRMAEHLVAQADGPRLRQGRLLAPVGADQRALELAIGRAASTALGASAAGGSTLLLRRTSLARPFVCHVCPASHKGVGSFLDDLCAPRTVLVLVVDPELRPQPPEAVVREVLGLTPAETRLVLAIASGRSLREHAEAAGITEGTARHYLKHALNKSGVNRQAQLVRLVLSLLPAGRDGP